MNSFDFNSYFEFKFKEKGFKKKKEEEIGEAAGTEQLPDP